MTLAEKLASGRVLVSDGAWGTFLHGMGLGPGECPELWNITHREAVLSIAGSYVEAGSDIIETNSFGGSGIKLAGYGLGFRASELNEAAAAISAEAAGKDVTVGGSVGPTGKLLFMEEISWQEMYDSFAEQCLALEKGGASMLIIETMTALDEAICAVKAARENTRCTVALTMTFSATPAGEYRTMMGVSPAEMVADAVSAGADIVGSNCGNGIAAMTGIVEAIRSANNTVPILIQANAGVPQYSDGKTVFRETPEMMASFVPELVKAGASIIGGCCGTTPSHIRAIAAAAANCRYK
jgi:5-methyltetrahydrofolate--homocysteine methyltransferase